MIDEAKMAAAKADPKFKVGDKVLLQLNMTIAHGVVVDPEGVDVQIEMSSGSLFTEGEIYQGIDEDDVVLDTSENMDKMIAELADYQLKAEGAEGEEPEGAVGVSTTADSMRRDMQQLLTEEPLALMTFKQLAYLATAATLYMEALNIEVVYRAPEAENLERLSKIRGLGYPDGGIDP